MNKTKTLAMLIFSLILLLVFISSASAVTVDTGYADTELNTQRKMAYDSSGNLYCVYYAHFDMDIRFAKSTDDGDTWTPTELVGDTGIAEITTYHQRRPSIAIDSNDVIHVLWMGQHAGSTTYYQIRYANSTDGGSTWSSPINITSDNYNHYAPAVAIDSSDNLYVAWDSCHAGSPSYFDIRMSKSTDNGDTWSAPITVSVGTNGDDWDASIAIDSNGYIHVVWDAYINDGSNEDICYAKSTNGGTSFPTYTKISVVTDNFMPCIAIDSNDYLHVVWEGSVSGLGAYNIVYRKYTDSWQSPVYLTNEDVQTQAEPTITLDRTDNVHIVWAGKIAGVYYVRCINYTGSWGSIWNTGLTTAENPVSLWANYPSNTNVPTVGFCCVYTSGTNTNFLKSSDFTMSSNFPPTSSGENPSDAEENVSISVGYWNVTITDADGDTTDGSIECSNGDSTTWSTEGNGTRSLTLSTLEYTTEYTIWLNYTDGTANVNEVFSFNTEHSPIVRVCGGADAGWYNTTQYATIQDGLNNVSENGTLYIWEGTYAENIVINKQITIIGNDTETVIVHSSAGALHSEKSIFTINSPHVNISNIFFDGRDYAYTRGVFVCNNYSYVANSSFTNFTQDAIRLDANTDEILVYNNTIFDSRYGIVFDEYTSNVTVQECNIYSMVTHSIWMGDNVFDVLVCDNFIHDSPTHGVMIITISDFSSDIVIENNTILNMTGAGAPSGVFIQGECYNIVVSDNHINNTEIGVYVYADGTYELTGNTITNILYDGLDVEYADDVEISNNDIEYCSLDSGYSGIYCYRTDNIHVNNCNISHIYRRPYGSVGSSAFGISLNRCTNVLVENTDLYDIKSHLSYSYGLRAWSSSSNITIQDCSFINGQIGIYIGYSDNISILDSDFINHIRGTGLGEPFIKLIECFDILIDNNTCSDNDHYAGFILIDIADFIVSNNTVENIEDDSCGLLIYTNAWDWETSAYNKNGLIYNNYIANTTDDGIAISYYNNVTIRNNFITNCGNDATEYGFQIGGTGETLFYNNFLNNTNNVDSSATHVSWNITKTLGTNIIGGPYLGGNFWSDYDGVDKNLDGLGDTTYVISSGDYYPLVYTADFDYNPKNISTLTTVTFLDQSLGTFIGYLWNFDDGHTSTEKNPKHRFAEDGTYEVVLTVYSDTGFIASCSKFVTVGSKDFHIVFPEDGGLPYTVPEMYHLLRVDLIPRSNAKLKILFIDTGCTPRIYNTTDLSVIKATGDPMYDSFYDEHGHGTWISYAIQYIIQEKLPNAEVISYRLFDENGYCYMQQVIDAFDYALKIKADIVSFSGGGIGNPDDALSKKVENLRNNGIFVIVAAGNSGPSSGTILTPACSRGAFAIGATDPLHTILNIGDDLVCTWSSRGPVNGVFPKPNYACPGESIIGPWLQSELSVSGTSMATPLFAGGTAVVYGNNQLWLNIVDFLYFWDGGIKQNIVEQGIHNTVNDKGDTNSYGYGIPDFNEANSAVFWICIFYIVIWFIVLIIIILIIRYIYKKLYGDENDKKKEKRYYG